MGFGDGIDAAVLCYNDSFEDIPVVSKGVFLGGDPFKCSLPMLLLELCFIFVVSRTIHFVLQPLHQPQIVSQILTGLFLGPSVLGQSSKFRNTMFPESNLLVLDNLAFLSFTLFVFLVGVKTDVSLLKKSGKPALVLCIASSLLPNIGAGLAAAAAGKSIPTVLTKRGVLMYLGGRLALSSFPVVSSALEELGLLNSELGRLVLSSALISEVFSYGLHSTIMWYLLIIKLESPGKAAAAIGSLFFFLLLIYFVVRPVILWVMKRTPSGELVGEGCFLGMLLSAMLAASLSESIGYVCLKLVYAILTIYV